MSQSIKRQAGVKKSDAHLCNKVSFTYVKDREIRVQTEFLLYHFFQLFTVPVQYGATILTAQCKKRLAIFPFLGRDITNQTLPGPEMI
jgi:hypothetical protein